MRTTKKIVANQLNARRSSGPRTATGKDNSRRNAVKHGFFSEELVFTDIEKAEFQALHRSLQSQLKPKTALLWKKLLVARGGANWLPERRCSTCAHCLISREMESPNPKSRDPPSPGRSGADPVAES